MVWKSRFVLERLEVKWFISAFDWPEEVTHKVDRLSSLRALPPLHPKKKSLHIILQLKKKESTHLSFPIRLYLGDPRVSSPKPFLRCIRYTTVCKRQWQVCLPTCQWGLSAPQVKKKDDGSAWLHCVHLSRVKNVNNSSILQQRNSAARLRDSGCTFLFGNFSFVSIAFLDWRAQSVLDGRQRASGGCLA